MVFKSVIMVKCFKCNNDFQLDLLVKHLKQNHGLFENLSNFFLVCPNCKKIFYTYCGYKRHINKCLLSESNVVLQNTQSNNSVSFQESGSNHVDALASKNADLPIEPDSDPTELPSIEDEFDAKMYTLNFCSKLHSLGIPETSIQCVIENTCELIDFLLDDVCHTVYSNLKQPQNELKSLLDHKIDNVLSDMKTINTSFKRRKEFNKFITQPKQVSLGVRLEQVFDRSKQSYLIKNVPCQMAYIPIISTITSLLDNSNFFNLIKSHALLEKDSSIISDISDGHYVKNNELFVNPLNLRILLYFDEFETVNPLGSKTGGHKIGAFYFIICNIPNYLNSQLNNIHLAMLSYTSDIKQFGINVILEPLIQDLKTLERQGILLQADNSRVYCSLVGLSHDNLGANTLLGMVESFTATYFCRICTADKNEANNLNKTDKSLLRNVENYKMHCSQSKENKIHVFGVKNYSILFDLKYFNAFDAPSVDCMHDFLEGVAPYELKLFLKFLILQGAITLNTIQNRLQAFPFGKTDKCDKPSPIDLDKPGHRIGQRAAQTWCLLRFIPLILSDVISSSPIIKRSFKVVTSLLNLMQFVFSTRLNNESIVIMENLIESHLKLFDSIYKNSRIPKHHIITHYPYVMRCMGPVVNLWTMRFEAKHAYFKNLVPKIRNFKNICYTLAYRHQLHMFHHWQNRNVFNKIDQGPTRTVDFDYPHVNLHSYGTVKNIYEVKWLKDSYYYEPGLFICTEFGNLNENPVFSAILDILIINGENYLILEPWATICYETDLCIYIIKKSNRNNSAIIINTLVYKEPFEKYQVCTSTLGTQWCIVPKYKFL